MSLLGAVALDFSEQLKASCKGWEIWPVPATPARLVDRQGKSFRSLLTGCAYLQVRTRDNNTSPLAHFLTHPPAEDSAFILVRAPHQDKRLVELRLRQDNQILLAYWMVNGFKAVDEGINGRYGSREWVDQPEGWDTYKINQVFHVRKPSQRRPYELVIDRFELGDPRPRPDLADTTRRVLTRSHAFQPDRYWSRFALAVDLEGRALKVDEHTSRWNWHY